MVKLPGARRNTEVVGESNFQPALKRVAKRYQDHESASLTATLIREPKNKHDSNAVQVRLSGSTVGYLSREDAIRYQPLLRELERRGQVAEVDASLAGGDRERPSIGIFLSLAAPDKASSVLGKLPEPLAISDDEIPETKRGLLSRLRGR